MHKIVRLASVIVLALSIGCSDSTGPVSLSLARLRWEKQNLHNYAFNSLVSCFCNTPGYVHVTVLSDTVHSVFEVSTGAEVAKHWGYTVNDLFDYAANAFAEKDRKVRIEFDPDLGYPRLLSITCAPEIADCGVALQTSNLSEVVID